MTDWSESFDASVGLAFSLRAFETYHKSGTLSAEIRSMPGVRGRCTVYLELAQGKIVACYSLDQRGQRRASDPQDLILLDQEKGPFGWVFKANTAPLAASAPEPVQQQPDAIMPHSPIPHPLVPFLNPALIQQWTPQQQGCIQMIFSMANGQTTVDEMKKQISLPPAVVDDVIRILLSLGAIALQKV